MESRFEKIKGRLGFGCMRFPLLQDGEVDIPKVCEMFDEFMAAGFNYFDTAHGYIKGKSEPAIKTALVDRYPRESYVLTNKLSTYHFNKEEEIRPLFESQLKATGTDYFDFYLMHAQDGVMFEKYKKCRAYEIALELLGEGKIKHFGISFHDTPSTLEKILTEYPEIEVVQIQYNYADYDDDSVQSRGVLEVCKKFGKPAIVMEPVKGGCLVNLPDNAKAIFDELNGGSYASYAIRFAAGSDGVFMVLSGMGDLDMVKDNTSYMKSFSPLNEDELRAVWQVRDILRGQGLIPCTSCKYCTEVCPKGIAIPNIFACLNSKDTFNNWNSSYYYDIHTQGGAKASDCIKCGKCEAICPQHLKIRELLERAVREFEKEDEK